MNRSYAERLNQLVSHTDSNVEKLEVPLKQQKRMDNFYTDYLNSVERTYDSMINAGVAKEQARIVLPLSQYTEVYWTASFQAIMNFIELRDESTAQWEIQQYAKVIKELMLEIYPETTKIWSSVWLEK